MELTVMAIRDRALDTFMQPFFTPTIGAAIRAFQDGVNDQQTPMYKHPEDYDLYQLATFNDHTGAFTNLKDGPKQVAIGKDLKQG